MVGGDKSNLVQQTAVHFPLCRLAKRSILFADVNINEKQVEVGYARSREENGSRRGRVKLKWCHLPAIKRKRKLLPF